MDKFPFLGIDATCYCYLWRISSIIRAKDAPTCCTYTRQVKRDSTLKSAPRGVVLIQAYVSYSFGHVYLYSWFWTNYSYKADTYKQLFVVKERMFWLQLPCHETNSWLLWTWLSCSKCKSFILVWDYSNLVFFSITLMWILFTGHPW